MKGQGISSGIAMGRVLLYKGSKLVIERREVEDWNFELNRFYKAIDRSKIEIDKLYYKALKTIGKKEAEIFSAHKMILEDPEFIKAVEEKIKYEKINVEWAVKKISKRFIKLFEKIEDEYLKERATDFKEVSDRILKILLNIDHIDLLCVDEKSIIVAKELSAADITSLNKEMIEGFVTEVGGETSHASILARTLGIPAIVGVSNIMDSLNPGDFIVINGDSGDLILNPGEEKLQSYIKNQENQKYLKKKLENMIGKETITKDKYKVKLLANISSLSDLHRALEKDAEGIGLFSSEYLYMNSKNLPTEEEQFQIYKELAIKLKDKALTIRTLDIGGDKEISYLQLPKETNPFLGYRAIRICLDNPEILKTQLRAIYRASYFGNIKIMFPMISSIEELRAAKEISKRVRKDLKDQNIGFSNKVEVGIMVEVPAVAIHARAFAKEVDFFSIGTNDLIQYTMAVDRGNQNISHLYSQYHPSVLRLIKMTIDAAHEENIPVAMCGEMAGEEKLIPLLLGMGLDEFSINTASILKARYQIRNICRGEIEAHIPNIINLSTGEDVKKYIEENINKKL